LVTSLSRILGRKLAASEWHAVDRLGIFFYHRRIPERDKFPVYWCDRWMIERSFRKGLSLHPLSLSLPHLSPIKGLATPVP